MNDTTINLWGLSREAVRDLCRRYGVARGQNKEDSIRYFMMATRSKFFGKVRKS